MTNRTSPNFGSADLYTRLGVKPNASAEDIKAAYLSLVRQHTPERAPETFKRIREAYETLSNPVARAQYDARPDPRVVALIEQASQAMRQEDYSAAELAYKQILLEVPDLHWVRNLLGLCFLYQGQYDKAIVQFQRLIRETTADATIHGNAAQAYRMAKRFDDAEREFRAAMGLAGDQSVEYGLALIQMWVDAGNGERADELAVAQANAAPAGSPAATEYAAKRIEIALVLGKKAKIPLLVEGVTKGLSTDGQKRYAAFALGKIAIRLITNELFDLAEDIAQAAKRLQPDDPDYDGQEQVSHLLAQNDFVNVRRILNTHVAFAAEAWLHPLKATIEQYCATHAAFQGMRPISSPPTLRTINGVGTALYGHRDEDPHTGTYVATQYFVLVFIPLFPLTCYRVRPAPNGGWYFLGKVAYAKAQKVHWAAFLGLLLLWMISSTFDSRSTTSTAGSSSPVGSVVPSPPPASSSPQSFRPGALAVYDGQAENTTAASAPIRSQIRVSFNDWSHAPNGYLEVYPPLGGSGPFIMQATGDSVKLGSVSETGDTILWLGRRTGAVVRGDYFIVGGRFTDQHGTWRISLTSGSPIPMTVELR